MFKTYISNLFKERGKADKLSIAKQAVDELDQSCGGLMAKVGVETVKYAEKYGVRVLNPEGVRASIRLIVPATLGDRMTVLIDEVYESEDKLVSHSRCRAAAQIPSTYQVRKTTERMFAVVCTIYIRILLIDAISAAVAANTKRIKPDMLHLPTFE